MLMARHACDYISKPPADDLG